MPEPFPEELTASILGSRSDFLAYLWTLSGDRDLADDLFQDACLEAGRSFERFRKGSDFAAWFRGIGRNLLARHRRREGRRGLLALTDEVDLAVTREWAATPRGGAGDDRREALERCLEALPAGRRELLRLRYNDHVSLRELARVADRSEDALKMLLHRLRRRLETCIRERLERDR